MQYLEIIPGSIYISEEMPIALLAEAINQIESTVNGEGENVEAILHDGCLRLTGKGEVSEIEPLVCGLNMIDPFVKPGSSIDIQREKWETTVILSSTTLLSAQAM